MWKSILETCQRTLARFLVYYTSTQQVWQVMISSPLRQCFRPNWKCFPPHVPWISRRGLISYITLVQTQYSHIWCRANSQYWNYCLYNIFGIFIPMLFYLEQTNLILNELTFFGLTFWVWKLLDPVPPVLLSFNLKTLTWLAMGLTANK